MEHRGGEFTFDLNVQAAEGCMMELAPLEMLLGLKGRAAAAGSAIGLPSALMGNVHGPEGGGSREPAGATSGAEEHPDPEDERRRQLSDRQQRGPHELHFYIYIYNHIYICIYIYIYICTYIYIYIYIDTYTNIHPNINTDTYIYAYNNIYIYTGIYIYIHMYMCI